jgi:tryptophan synthase alpha subunit
MTNTPVHKRTMAGALISAGVVVLGLGLPASSALADSGSK